ncbi:ATP-binding cassette domain-containing protein [Luteococcus sp. H138]|uniref:sulfate/molybdate ABC transporter ATP-binding protein n=1 Tax=unclassified Luteococcus TaxID=2639923 RepID=UPI00313DC085
MFEPDGVRINARVAVRDVQVDLAFPAGLTTAVVGPNGAGKTTLVQLVDGRLRPDAGSVALGGMTITDASTHLPTHRRPIALLQQRPLLFPHLDVLDNVAFGPRARGASRRRARERASAELAAVGAEHLAGRRPASLSGGQAQRVALARALATDPAVLLLDEPFVALDVGVAAVMRQLLARRLATPPRPTTLLVTHDPLDLWAVADQLVCLEAGRVTAQGAVAELLGRPTTGFLAELSGTNLIRGRIDGGQLRAEGVVVAGLWDAPVPDAPTPARGAWALATFDPSAVSLHRDAPGGSPRNVWPVVVVGIDPRGATARIRLTLPQGGPLAADLTAQSVAALGIAPGKRLYAQVKATQVRLHLRPEG